jgi:indolepyruvate ferredoxin oxidoreductase
MDAQFTLSDKYNRTEGTVLLTGNQAVVRLAIEQARLDRAAGHRTGTFVSGYPGSPLGVLDRAFVAARAELEPLDIVHQPGTNEELAAVAVWGSQQTPRRYSGGRAGVVGIWYGKAPGVDRSGDSFRHGNFMGAHPAGGVIALAGDDPSAKSSTLPTDSQYAFYDLAFPIITPSTIADIIELGLHAINLSRFSGNWVGVKLVTNLCDGLATVRVRPENEIVLPKVEVGGRPWRHRQLPSVLTPVSLEQEAELFGGRLVAAKAYLEANNVNPVIRRTADDRIGVISYGKPFTDLLEAFDLLGLDPDRPGLPPIRVLKLGASYPLPENTIREFARGLTEILVVEEKRSFVESQVRDILYPLADRPVVLGKRDRQDLPLVPGTGELNQARISEVLRKWLRPYLPELEPAPAAPRTVLTLIPKGELPSRPAAFCSGCPHSRSTVIPDGALSAGGCGCHSMIYVEPRHRDDDLFSVVPMGTEGAEWIGLAPFTDTPHMFQNIGDGTYFHSGVNAVRACIAAGMNMTFKLLFNSAIAMTGGQDIPGIRGPEALTRELEAMGVARTIVCTDNTRKYRGRRVAGNAQVRPSDDIIRAQAELANVPGVTVLLYDQYCAAEARRLRKRGALPTPAARVVINEAVCEGCGDCQTKSNCLSVVSVATDLGRKTQIQDSSCNRDYSCLRGDCPSFVTVVPGRRGHERAKPAAIPAAPAVGEPARKAEVPADPGSAYGLLLAGIGGTGVMTANQILAVAATIEGFSCVGLDQTGLAQKGGPVLSHLRISRAERPRLAGASAPASVDAYLVFDPIVGVSEPAMACLSPARTTALISSDAAATRDMVVEDAMRDGPDVGQLVATISARCAQTTTMSALSLSEAAFGDHMPANIVLLGAAYQSGLVPLSAESIEQAIRLNGVSVEKNLAAFAWGRSAVGSTDAGQRARRLGEVGLAPSQSARNVVAGEMATIKLPEGLADRVVTLAAELYDYGGQKPVTRYLSLLAHASLADQAAATRTAFTEAVAESFFKLLAYKDEYEVARLLLKDDFLDRISRDVGPSTVYFHLHPPLLRVVGLDRKIKVRATWGVPALRALRVLRPLRGTALDPFGHTRMRRQERQLIDDYERAVRAAAALLPDDPDRALAAAKAPQDIRGYEQVKQAGIDSFYQTAGLVPGPSDAALAGLRSSTG